MGLIQNKNTNGSRERWMNEREMMQELTPGDPDYGKVRVGTDGTEEGEILLAKVGDTQLLGTISGSKGVSYTAASVADDIVIPTGVNAMSIDSLVIEHGGSLAIEDTSTYKII